MIDSITFFIPVPAEPISPRTLLPGPFTYRLGTRSYDLSARPHIMGVLNVTPDSFSDGGKFLNPESGFARALAMIAEGADIIDVGGESTRPRGTAYGDGAQAVGAGDELRRVLPLIKRLRSETDVPISIDTFKSEVAGEALAAGACIVNDISGFHFDPAMPEVAGKAGATAVLMHIQGTPTTMQADPKYADLFGEIRAYLREGIGRGIRAGVRQMLVDPGIGFGKTLSHNLRLLANLGRFHDLGYPLLVGPSRKSFIGTVLGLPVEDRLEGTLAAVTAAVLQGAHVVRVHDVREARRAADMAAALRSEQDPEP